MFDSRSRREFLKVAASGVAGLAAAEMLADGSVQAAAPEAPQGEISVRVTDKDRRYASAPSLRWKSSAVGSHGNIITLDPTKRYQPVLGFGAAFTDASCYVFNQLPATERTKLFHELFSSSEMGLSVGRICVGSSDYSVSVYSFDEGAPDPELARFSIDHDRAYILPMLAEARKVNPELFLLASSWSPPGWMKSSNTMLGGAIWRHYFGAYASYFAKFLKAYSAAGVAVNAITTQNEVDTDQDGRMPAAMWPQEYEMDFVRDHLGPKLVSENLDTKIWLLDHNYSLWGRAICMLDDPGVRKYADGIAWHGYVGTPELMSRAHEYHPNIKMYWTEGGPDITAPDYATDWAKWSATFTDILQNWCRCIIGWNLALDEHGKPNLGPFPCGGVVTIDSKTGAITRSGQYWALAHFSRAVRRGAVRLASQSKSAEARHVGFANPDGSMVLVVTNPGAARSVQVQIGGSVSEVALPVDSVTTLTWQG
jgi:glucosylceramidase